MNGNEPLTNLKGVGEKTAGLLRKLNLETIRDLLDYYPRTYQKIDELKTIKDAVPESSLSVYASIEGSMTQQYIKRLNMLTATISDGTGSLCVRWFNMPYLKNTLKTGYPYVFSGKIVKKGSKLIMEQPSIYPMEKYCEISKSLQPVYALTKGVTGNLLSKLEKEILAGMPLLRDPLPDSLRRKYKLAEMCYSYEQIHFPEDEHHLLLARKRLVFQEFLYFILTLRQFKERQSSQTNGYSIEKGTVTDQVIANLGYTLTSAQKTVWEEIQKDLLSDRIMTRLVQGDVGSGKTIVAFLAMLLMAENHLQSALMVPTEVLARQHFEALQKLLEKNGLPFHAVLLTGSMTAKQKRLAYEKITAHETDFIIGTHAIIQEQVLYDQLALVITDEQHRFGVKQREMLEQKGQVPHTMVMSATPIPRTLAVILYGDLDISLIDEMPSNRVPIKNCVVNTSYRPKAYAFIEKEVSNGHQCYVICPMVEESELLEAEDVISYTEKLKASLNPDINIAYLHGKMKAKEKNQIMESFLVNEIQVLVSTTVIEVGVNVPNATVIMIENAERFGLAQLHQLRGRVGRGSVQSYCIMMVGSEGAEKKKRLEILNKSNDGFYIASEDLKLRGPGDILGVRQSGMLEFKIADIYSDAKILKEAAIAADELYASDPEFILPENRELKQDLNLYWEQHLIKLNL